MQELEASPFQTRHLPEQYNNLAPDGSEIRLLLNVQAGGLCHCTLPAGGVTQAVAHRSVEEIWYCLAGSGEVWRKQAEAEEITPFIPGVSLSIPRGTHFQFRTTGSEPLRFLIATMPPWPGTDEALLVEGPWAIKTDD